MWGWANVETDTFYTHGNVRFHYTFMSNVLIKKSFLCVSQKHSEEATKAASSEIFVCKNRERNNYCSFMGYSVSNARHFR